MIIANRLQALPQILVPLKMGVVLGVFISERQQSLDCAELIFSGYSRFAFGARSDNQRSDGDDANDRPEDGRVPGGWFLLWKEQEQIRGRPLKRIERKK